MPSSYDDLERVALWRLPQILRVYPISRSAWWQGVKDKRFPQPIKLGPRTTAWRARDVIELLEKAGKGEQAPEQTSPSKTKKGRKR